ncbi:MAG: hypothetical protein M3506_01665 [Chloroflexota bacterium]|nr:hypothetical protein [Chloroflexota bacterium]
MIAGVVAVLMLGMVGWSVLTAAPGLARTPGQDPQGTPNAQPSAAVSPTAPPLPTTTANAIEGTVAGVAVADNTLTINGPSGLQPIVLEPALPILRNGLPSSLDQVEATDRVIIQRDAQNKVLSVLTFAAPATPVVTQTAPAVGTPTSAVTAPEPVSTGTVIPIGTVTPGAFSGTITETDEGVLTVQGFNGETRPVNAANVPNLDITRGGISTELTEMQVGDTVEINYGPNNVPTRIAATPGPGTEPTLGPDYSWIWYTLAMLAILLAPLLLIFTPAGRGPGRFVMARRRR